MLTQSFELVNQIFFSTQSGQYSGVLLCSSRQQTVQNTAKTFPEHVSLERVFALLLGLHTHAMEPGFRFVSSTWCF